MSPAPTSWHRLTRMSLGLTVLLGLLLTAFAWPLSAIEPRNLPIAAVAPPPVLEQMQAGALPEGIDLQTLGTREEAVTAISQRDVYGAIVLAPDGAEILTASAASPMVAQLLGQIGAQAGPPGEPPPTVTDVVPLPDGDPRGVIFGVGSLPVILGGLIAGAAFAFGVRGPARVLAGLTGVAVLGGLTFAAILGPWLDALGGSYFANAGVIALAIAALAFPIVGLHALLGRAGLGLGVALMMLVGNPLSGMSTAPEMLPGGAFGQLLPPGALGTALRSVAFFDGHGATQALIVLIVWALLGAGLALIPARSAASAEAAEPLSERAPAPAAG